MVKAGPATQLSLYGTEDSLYFWIARLALHERGLSYDIIEMDPFDPPLPDNYLALHPFGRIPTLVHDDFALYEASAILRYVDQVFDGPSLVPADARAAARMSQLMSLLDDYAVNPMIAKVVSERLFSPLEGEEPNEEAIAEGLRGADRALAAVEAIVSEGLILNQRSVTLADLYLGPFIGYFVMPPEGVVMLRKFPALSRWYDWFAARPSAMAANPGPPTNEDK
ncbi:glutathione S-transferase [Ruegeria halocynthiae]|uniref:Glutathione S-transferase n=1 Tax=Ruegeria halocynthiae TaxID=985054 RepID=A0A1H2YHK7_9RHOB|nr:glutathione S-transferase family protein [Ruegeria halocynthiae]SDX04114.1 glutathione S-transferase [Ruegeria halocynthiae]